MQVQHAFPHSQRLGSVNWKFRRAQLPMESDDGLVLKWRPLLANLQPPTIGDQYIFRLQLNVCFIKHQSPA